MITAALTLLHCPCVFLFVALIFLLCRKQWISYVFTSAAAASCNYWVNLLLVCIFHLFCNMSQILNTVWRLGFVCWQSIKILGLFHGDNFFGFFQGCLNNSSPCLTTVSLNVDCFGRTTLLFHGSSWCLSVDWICWSRSGWSIEENGCWRSPTQGPRSPWSLPCPSPRPTPSWSPPPRPGCRPSSSRGTGPSSKTPVSFSFDTNTVWGFLWQFVWQFVKSCHLLRSVYFLFGLFGWFQVSTCLWKFVKSRRSVVWMKFSTLSWRPHLKISICDIS